MCAELEFLSTGSRKRPAPGTRLIPPCVSTYSSPDQQKRKEKEREEEKEKEKEKEKGLGGALYRVIDFQLMINVFKAISGRVPSHSPLQIQYRKIKLVMPFDQSTESGEKRSVGGSLGNAMCVSDL